MLKQPNNTFYQCIREILLSLLSGKAIDGNIKLILVAIYVFWLILKVIFVGKAKDIGLAERLCLNTRLFSREPHLDRRYLSLTTF